MDGTDLAQAEKLPLLIEQAAAALAKATTAAEVLEARDAAALAYDAAKAVARFAKAKQAHDTIIVACHKAQADALLIEARAQCRLADEYDAAQARGEVAKHGELGRNRSSQQEHLLTVEDTGLTRKQVHEARRIRDAEKKKPGVLAKTLADVREEPTRARLRRAVEEVLTPPKPPPVEPRASFKSSPEQIAKAEETEAESEDTSSDVDYAIDIILDHLETLESKSRYDQQRRFVDEYILLPVGLSSMRITRRGKLTWEPMDNGYYKAYVMKETHVPFYLLCPSETDNNLYGVHFILGGVGFEILVDEEKEPLSLAEAKKFAEAHHAEEK